MNFLKNKILNIIVLILSVFLMSVPFIISPVCPAMGNGMYMNCHYTANLVMYIAVGISIVTMISLFINNKIINMLLNIISLVLAVSVHLIPHRIVKIAFGYIEAKKITRYYGFCASDKMECIINSTFYITSVIAILIVVVLLINIVYNMISKER